MTSGTSAENRVQEVSQISRSLKVLARDLDVPIIAISQLSRAVEQRHDKRPILSDLRESGSIEQDADLVMFIYRDEYYNGEESDSQGLAELHLAKHRNGPTDMVKLSFLRRFAKFADLRTPREEDGADGRPSGDLARSGRDAYAVPCERCREERGLAATSVGRRWSRGRSGAEADVGFTACWRGHRIRVRRISACGVSPRSPA